MRRAVVLNMGRLGRAVNEPRFEGILSDLPDVSVTSVNVHFDLSRCLLFSPGLALRFLSVLNQLDLERPGQISVEFSRRSSLFSNLDRSGFFALLSPTVSTYPERPAVSQSLFRNRLRANVPEICALIPGASTTQRKAVVKALCEPLDRKSTRDLKSPAFTVLTELCENVFIHSDSHIPGYASLNAQFDARRPRLEVAVSDSGQGIPETIRSAIGGRFAKKSDWQIVVEAFRQGLSRMGRASGRGCGLVRCAQLAAEYRSELIVRTPYSLIRLRPWHFGNKHGAHVFPNVRQIRGTHICFQFRLTPQDTRSTLSLIATD
jgi:hypothetical protein